MSEPADAEDATGGRTGVWIEKYRPDSLDDVVGHEDIVPRLESYIAKDDLPHLLLAGPAGTGKCTTGETPVLTNEGVERIEDVVGDVDGFASPPDGLEVATFTESGEFEFVEPTALLVSPEDRHSSICNASTDINVWPVPVLNP